MKVKDDDKTKDDASRSGPDKTAAKAIMKTVTGRCPSTNPF